MAVLPSVVFWIASLSLAAGVRQNVAKGKPAWMSTTDERLLPDNAVDGVTTARNVKYSAHTREGEATAWWKADLKREIQSAVVDIYFRTNYKYRRNGLQLYTSGTAHSDPKEGDLCHTVCGSPNGTDIPDVLNVTCPGTWRYLTVYTETANDKDGAVLDFVEVQVWSEGQNVVQGKPTWMSTTFERSHSADNAVDGVTTAGNVRYSVHTKEGEATAWWKADLKREIQSAVVKIYFRRDYKYRRNGLQLYTSGTNSCNTKDGDLCHTVRGRPNGKDIPDVLNVTCPGTWRYLTVYTETDNDDDGAVLDFVEVQVWSEGQNVAQGKPAWMSTSFECSHSADNAVDGVTTAEDVRYSVRTKEGEATAWWKADMKREIQSAVVDIYFRTNYKYRRNGLQLYTSGTNSCNTKDGDLCHTVRGRPDGKDIPDVLNVTCPGTWRYLTVYTETDNDGDGAVLDFVEVQVWICASGYYGANCEQSCAARHCKMDSSCDVTLGQCVGGCAAGYQGADCSRVCASGYYGANCEQSCAARHCKMDFSCDVTLGQCVGGCAAGYQGADCSRACASGYYGANCEKSCAARHCKMNSSCDVTVGQCVGGCAAGYRGTDCNRELESYWAVTPTTAGIIGAASGVPVMLIVGVGLCVMLIRQKR